MSPTGESERRVDYPNAAGHSPAAGLPGGLMPVWLVKCLACAAALRFLQFGPRAPLVCVEH
jgi:hypothetical protein